MKPTGPVKLPCYRVGQLVVLLVLTTASYCMPPPPPQPTQTSKLVLSRSLCEDCEVEANRTETVTCTLSHCHPPIDSHHDIGFYIIRRAQSLFPVHDQATDPYLGPINMSHVMHHGNNMCSRTLSFNTSEQIDGLGIQCHSHGHNGVKTSNAYIIAVHVHVQSTEAPSTIPTACPTPECDCIKGTHSTSNSQSIHCSPYVTLLTFLTLFFIFLLL